MKQARTFTETELKRVLAIAAVGKHAKRNRCAIMLSFLAGLRVGEIAQLKNSDVFSQDGTIKDQIILKAAYTKTKETRVVYVGKRLHAEILRYQRSLQGPLCHELTFLRTQKRTAFSPNTLCQLFSNIYKQAGLEGASSHSGRRTFITKLAHSGVSPKVIMTLAGHKNLTTTQRYIDVNDEMLKSAVELA